MFCGEHGTIDYCPECMSEGVDVIAPEGFQIVSEKAIQFLYDNHRVIYDGFYELVDKS